MAFRSLWLLWVGLPAAAIPVLLHLLSSVRAREMFFPTLRFLRISMEKTARRRRIEHWLLLVIRSLLLALLATAVAEPFLRARAVFLADPRTAAALIVDNSYSMAVQSGGESRFDRARREVRALLDGKVRPSQAALVATNAAAPPRATQSDLGPLREDLGRLGLASGRAAVPERIAEAAKSLQDASASHRVIYVFSDLQRISFESLPDVAELAGTGIPLMLVDCSAGPAANVGISELALAGTRIVDRPVDFTATVINSSPTPKTVTISLHADGRQQGAGVPKTLARSGQAGAKATVHFSHAFAQPGLHVGHVAIQEADDLAVDNVRHFCLEVADRVGAVLVRPASPGQSPAAPENRPAGVGAFDPAVALQTALDPYAGAPAPWPVRLKTISVEQLSAEALGDVQVAFLADVPSFTPAQADALEQFVRRGGSAVFFLGPNVNVQDYNDRLVERFRESGGLLPARLAPAVGQVGAAARAVQAVRDLDHPYLAGLYKTPADYPEVLVQRYYRLSTVSGAPEKVLTTPAGEPILLAGDYHAGRVIVLASTASPEWNNLSTTALFLPIAARICLAAGDRLAREHTYAASALVTIRPKSPPGAPGAINVSHPDGTVEVVPLQSTDAGPLAAFTNTHAPGVYRWQLAGTEATSEAEGTQGAFAVNPEGAESDLSVMEVRALVSALPGVDVYVGRTLEEVHAAAARTAADDELWDRLTAIVILLLVVEAVVANRFRRGAEPLPARLNPRLTG